MMQKLEIKAIHTEIDDDLRKYVTKKIGRLDQYMSKHSRLTAHAVVRLKEVNAKDKKQSSCEVVLNLPHDVISTKETTVNMYAAVDIVEAKLKNQLKKYKEKHDSSKLRRRVIARLRRSSNM
ncbi:MAG: ribosome-associated translation inhibitor RaiA [Candidatus Saccharibacteria bacterium]